METFELKKDPYSVIITGTGGQGNVMASRVLSGMMEKQGYYVTIGETFGASQRGGSVMSHIRISRKGNWSPQISKGRADVVVALEPIEVARVLKDYGNPEVQVISNTYSIFPVNVISGKMQYPSLDKIKESQEDLVKQAWYLDVTTEGVMLGHHILANIIILGALSTLNELPMNRDDFRAVMLDRIPERKLDMNLAAYDRGRELMEIYQA